MSSSINATLQHAAALHSQGQLGQAEKLYRAILAEVPAHFDAMHLLGVIALQTGHAQAAVELIGKATAINRKHPAAHLHMGNALLELQRNDEALASYERALKLKPDYAEALGNRGNVLLILKRADEALACHERALKLTPGDHELYNNRGNALQDLNRPEEAMASYQRALALQPDYAEALSNYGNALLTLKRYDEALVTLDHAIALRPDFHQALFNRGNALLGLKRYADALASYDRAIALSPEFQQAIYNRGNALKELGQYDDALASFERAVAINPDDHEAHNNRGSVLQGLRRYEEALQSFDRALALKPDYVDALYNRGNALKDLWRYAEALQSYDRALVFKPDYTEALGNRGNVLEDMRRFEEALASYARALAIKPDYAIAHWNESLCRLRSGDFEIGWQKYEWGWESGERGKTKRDFPQPLWLGGQPLNGKTILLHAEQGLGDTIQFCRYARLLAEKEATVLLEVQPPLTPLLKHLEGVHQVLAKGGTLPAFDYHCPLPSLPLAFHTRLETIPAQEKYIYSDEVRVAAWQNKLGQRVKPRIGLVWSGSAGHRNDRNRSIPLADFVKLLSAGMEFISLQRDVRPADGKLLLARKDIAHFGDDLADFADTAALIELVDLVITIDTSVAHLAGAMGKAVWILLPFNSDFRWLLDRDDSPWYPSARLFRQPAMGDWDSVLTRVKRELADCVAIRR